MNISIGNIFQTLGYQIASRVSVPFWAGIKVSEIIKDIIEIIATVEKMMQDGQIDAAERRELAAKGIHMALGQFGIGASEEACGYFVDVLVAILNSVGILKKRK